MTGSDKILGVFEPGQHVERWRIEAEVRQGTQGGVLRGTDVDTGAPVAVKVAFVYGEFDTRRIDREREILAALDHPGVVALRGSGAYRGRLPFLVLEFVDGIRLDRFADELCLPLGDRGALFLRLCEATDHAHDRGVVHCDLNPSNVLVTGGGSLKVIDLGSGFLKGRPGHAGTGAEHRGTPQYMSPEQLREEPLDERTDVYSLGVILYQFLCGSTPFGLAGEEPDAVFRKEPESPSAAVFRRRLPPRLRAA